MSSESFLSSSELFSLYCMNKNVNFSNISMPNNI